MTQYIYIVDYELNRKFGDSNRHPVCAYKTFEAAKKRVDALFESTFNGMKAHLDPEEYEFETNEQIWSPEQLNGDAEGWCYSRQALSKCEAAYSMFGDPVADDLQICVCKIEIHPE